MGECGFVGGFLLGRIPTIHITKESQGRNWDCWRNSPPGREEAGLLRQAITHLEFRKQGTGYGRSPRRNNRHNPTEFR